MIMIHACDGKRPSCDTLRENINEPTQPPDKDSGARKDDATLYEDRAPLYDDSENKYGEEQPP